MTYRSDNVKEQCLEKHIEEHGQGMLEDCIKLLISELDTLKEQLGALEYRCQRNHANECNQY